MHNFTILVQNTKNGGVYNDHNQVAFLLVKMLSKTRKRFINVDGNYGSNGSELSGCGC